MNRLASGKDVLYSFHSVRDRIDGYTLHELSTVNDSIFRCLEVEKVTETDMENVKQNLVDYLNALLAPTRKPPRISPTFMSARPTPRPWLSWPRNAGL